MHSNHSSQARQLCVKLTQFKRVFLTLLFVTLHVSWAIGLQSGQNIGARIFPESTHVFLQIEEPDQLIDKIFSHPLREKIEALPPVKDALNSTQMKQGRIGLAFLETRIGAKWLPAIKSLTDNGFFVGADLGSQAVGVAFRTSDESLLKKTAGEILGFIKSQGGEDAFEVEEYRDGKFATIDNLVIARFGEWFIFSNNSTYAKKMADNLLDGIVAGKKRTDTLAAKRVFADAWKAFSGDGDAWVFADLGFIRRADVANQLFAGSTDNPAIELLFGGILEAMKDAEYVSANLALNDQSISVKSTLPFAASGFPENREFYFGTKAMGRAPAPLEIPGLLGQVSSYRDLGRWWLSKEELFPENVIAQLALAESQLSTFFGGADFGEEILGALQPGLRLVVKEQTYDKSVDPDIKLPAFALVGRLQNPDRETRFRISFNSFITLLNLSEEGDMPQFDVQTMSQQGYRITSAKYLVEDGVDEGLLYFNFSPSIAFQDDYMIISSTEEFAHELAQATQKIDTGKLSDSNTLLILDASTIQKQLELNKQSMIAKSMLDNGKTREQSTAEIDLAMSLLNYARQVRLDYRIEPRQMVLEVQLDFDF